MAIRKERRGGVLTGNWIATWKDDNGHWRPRTFKTQAEARKFLITVENNRQTHGKYIDTKDALPFTVVADRFVRARRQRVKIGKLTGGTLREQERHVETLKQIVAARKITDLSRGYIRDELLVELQVGRADKTVQNMFSTFKQIMAFAEDHDLLMSDPAARIKFEITRKKPQGAERISRSVSRDLIAALDGKRRLIVKFAMRTGVRFGEQAALTWDDIKFEDGKATITISKARKKDGSVDRPKTNAGVRKIRLACDLVQDLQRWKLAQPNIERIDNLVFPSRTGRMVFSSDNWRNRILIPACKEIGIEPIRWHDLRHVFASVLIYDLDLPWVQVGLLMGHRSIQFTINTYGHWREDEERDNQTAELMAAAW